MLGSGSSFQLARILGIRIGVNASWFIVLFLFIYLFQDSFQATLAASDTTAFAVAVAAAVLFALSQPAGCEVRELFIAHAEEPSWP